MTSKPLEIGMEHGVMERSPSRFVLQFRYKVGGKFKTRAIGQVAVLVAISIVAVWLSIPDSPYLLIVPAIAVVTMVWFILKMARTLGEYQVLTTFDKGTKAVEVQVCRLSATGEVVPRSIATEKRPLDAVLAITAVPISGKSLATPLHAVRLVVKSTRSMDIYQGMDADVAAALARGIDAFLREKYPPGSTSPGAPGT